MQPKTEYERPLFRMGAVAFIVGLVIAFGSTMLHPSSEDPTDHFRVFAEYAKSNTWIAVHIGQFAGGMLIFAGGFVALYRFLVKSSESGLVSALAWLGLATAILTASTLVILQAVDGISLKRAVDSWATAPQAEKVATFHVAEGIRWIEIGANSMFRILQGATGIIFGVAIAINLGAFPRWVGGIGIFAGILTMIVGMLVAYTGFAFSRSDLAMAFDVTYYVWVVIMGIYMWKRTTTKPTTS
jgi:hypothetical protein